MEIIQNNNIRIIAIDGRCASGKTTFTQKLADYLNAEVIHMDDFFLRNELKTKERLSEVGGNIDYERFTSDVLDETDFERMFREVAEMAEVKQREKETFERQQHEEELRQKAIAEQNKKAELLRAEKAKESAKKQQKVQNNNFDIDEEEATLPFVLNFSDASEVRRAFISSEILNRKY